MTTLVTGCAGFIGSNVCRMLTEGGETVVGVDNMNDAYDVRLKHWRLDGLESTPDFHYYNRDLADLGSMKSLFGRYASNGNPPFSSVINMGARAGVRPSVENPWVYYETNTLGTLNLLELCKDFGVKKFVLSSTSSAYGDNTPMPFKEDSDTSNPLSPYAASKKAAETMVYTYHHLHDIDATVLRYFTVYGPAGRPDMSIFIFIRAIAEGIPFTVFGDGKQSRDFTFVEDIARGTIAATRPLGYEISNLGNDKPAVLMDVINMIEDLVEKKAIIGHKPMHKADVRATWANIDKARDILEWEPKVPLEEGLKRTVDWYSQNREWANDIIVG